MEPYRIIPGDVLDGLRSLPDGSVHCCVTSPPYWALRDYGVAGQIGLEPTPEAYTARLVAVFAEVRRVLRDDGVCFINIGDSYFGTTPGSGGKTEKQATNAGSFFSGTRPNRSRADARPCGTDGTGLPGSPGAGPACPDCGGELTACSLIHRARNAGTSQLSEQAEQRPSRKARGNGRLDSASASPGASCSASHPSTTLSSAPSAPGAFALADAALEPRSRETTSLAGVQGSEHKSACNSDTVLSGHPSGDHTTGRAFVCTACGYSTKTHPKLKPKDLVGIPWRLAFALQADGWYLRSDIIWAKPNPMPESVTDRPTKAHEYLFLLSKRDRYYYDAESIKEAFADERMGNPGEYKRTPQPVKSGFNNDRHDLGFINNGGGWNADGATGGRNRRTVWTIATQPYAEAHFATYPEKLVEPCILAGCPAGGTVLDPFLGSGTTIAVAVQHGRNGIGCELNPEYAAMAERRIGKAMKPATYRPDIAKDAPLFGATA